MSRRFHNPDLARLAKIAESRKATMLQQGSGTQASAAQAALAAINNFLSVAPRKYYAILGTVASGSAGGANANVIWQQQIPIVPAFCTAIDYNITLPVTLTLQAGSVTTQTATLSPFAPYSAVANQLTLGGAPPWPLTELTPWYMDMVQHRINYDPDYPGLGDNSGFFGSITDQGPLANEIGGSGSLNPGSTVTNVTSAPVSTNYNFQFKVRQQLQRKRHLLWGAVPFGDPENRPNNLMQILPLVGSNPEQSLFVNVGPNASNSVVLNGAATIQATYELAYIDLLPPSMTAVPNPQVGYGLQLVQFSTTGLAAGTIAPITHRTAMAYTSIHQLLINGELPLRADYFGLWDDQDVQSSRWNYDKQVNTFSEYFDKFQRELRRYPLTGQYVADFEGGVFPEIPSVTPYDAIMSPDQSYAQAFGVPVTPAMTTALRIPSGTSLSSPYIRTYSFGLVRVPY